ncbi:HD-GYP domain-containing protein [Salidesulfovibrio onnuriiensis]|uniref:HD-GYP domain-containing protein n=1 Tax=Salidesulfovibrio onnuriiensis TaxID=2583823 RepID=UPI0011CC04BA|nr:HD domain-containing phosphohydrolase [Salidesulfovibrio onnuriiensis]
MLETDLISTCLPGKTCEGCAKEQLLDTLHQFAESLGEAIDAKDPCTRFHSEQVAEVSAAIAREMGLSDHDVRMIHIAGHLHDIGKIGIPDAILRKTNFLTSTEWEHIRTHPELGAIIVRPVEAFSPPGGVADIILHHHELYDGSGYPYGRSGTDIPLGSRIITVADALSARMQHRPYRQGARFDVAVRAILHCAGTHYDPLVVSAFEAAVRELGERILTG